MFKQGKYVTGEIRQPSGLDVLGAVIVPESVDHETLLHLFTEVILGAGFFHINDKGRVEAYGESLGLGIRMCSKDARLIEKSLGIAQEV